MKASIIALVGAAATASAGYNGTVPYTTSTITQTHTSTISECAATVTDCPYKTHPLTTVIVDVYTTYCPVAASASTAVPVPEGSTSTIYATETLTISSCAPTVTNCPYTTKPITVVTSSAVSTTVCPPSATGSVVPPPQSVSGGASAPASSPAPPFKTTTKPYVPVGTGVVVPPKTNTTIPFTGGASAQKAGGILMAVGIAAALL